MKLVVFADGITYPGKEGVSHHIMSQLFALCRHSAEIEPIMILCDRGTLSYNTLKEFPWKTIVVPHEVYYEYTHMRSILDTIKPDIVQSYGIYHGRLISSRYSLEKKIPFVMEHHDVELELTDHLKLNAELSKSIYHDQIELCELASLNRTLSDHDTDILVRATPHRKHTFFNLPTIVEDTFGKRNTHSKKANTVLFVGNGAYPPNRQAVNFIYDQLAPTMPNVTFHIVGRLSETIAAKKNVIGHGMIDDLSPLVDEAILGIAPLQDGSGLKIKVLTYLSAGLPVVGTPLAYHGFAKDRALTAASLKNFSTTLAKKLHEYQPQDSTEARALFMQKYSEQANIQQLITLYKNLQFKPYVTLSNSRPLRRNDDKLPWLKEFREVIYHPFKEVAYINFD